MITKKQPSATAAAENEEDATLSPDILAALYSSAIAKLNIARTAYLLSSRTDTDPARIQRDYFAAFDTSEDIARKLLIRD